MNLKMIGRTIHVSNVEACGRIRTIKSTSEYQRVQTSHVADIHPLLALAKANQLPGVLLKSLAHVLHMFH